MSGEKGIDPTSEFDDDDDVIDDSDDEDVAVDFDETVGDLSAQFKVDELVAKLDKSDDVEHRRLIRKRLEELREQREYEKELDSTFNFNLDDEL